ncbi:MAG: mediator complex subunit Med20 [Marteilia pararefringens]
MEEISNQMHSRVNESPREFTVSCENVNFNLFNEEKQKMCTILNDSDKPDISFIRTGDSSNCYKVASNFRQLISSISDEVRTRSQIEAKGRRYVIDDFLIRASLVYQSNTPKLLLIETQYMPCSYLPICIPIVKEFIISRLQLDDMTISQHLNNIKYLKFTYSDIILQYKEIFDHSRRATGVDPVSSSKS